MRIVNSFDYTLSAEEQGAIRTNTSFSGLKELHVLAITSNDITLGDEDGRGRLLLDRKTMETFPLKHPKYN